MYAFISSAKWYYTVLLISISLRTNNVEHPFICLVIILLLFSKRLLKWLVHFSVGLGVFLLLSCTSYLYTRHTNISFVVGSVNIFSQSLTCLLIFLTSFDEQIFKPFMRSKLATFHG